MGFLKDAPAKRELQKWIIDQSNEAWRAHMFDADDLKTKAYTWGRLMAIAKTGDRMAKKTVALHYTSRPEDIAEAREFLDHAPDELAKGYDDFAREHNERARQLGLQ